MKRSKANDFDQEVLDLFDQYVHGGIDRRQFLNQAGRILGSTVAATATLKSLSPDYALAQQVSPQDSRIETETLSVPSPNGHGEIRGLMVRPAGASDRLPGVVVVHENRGLNPYIEDVARRLGVAGFLALAPDGLTSLGGYPGNDSEGRQLQRQLDRSRLLEDFLAAVMFLQSHQSCTGKVGVVGFCFGGWVANSIAVRVPDLGGAVPFYGRQPAAADVPDIQAPLLIHYAGLDRRVNEGWPAYEAALKAAGKHYAVHIYDGVNHGFHNDTTPRYDEAAARLAWSRTLDFFNETLRD